MATIRVTQVRISNRWVYWVVLGLCCALCSVRETWAQQDQGAITGVVQDKSGASIPDAQITLKNIENGLVLSAKTDSSGIYNFSPIRIGHYTISATAPGFRVTTQENVQLSLQERLNVVIILEPGVVTETVTVSSAPPLLQTQQGSVGQVISTRTINDTPLNGRNWVYIAQLTAGTNLSVGSRGGGSGDFEANGQQPEQNNFILDGVDNNVNSVDFLNGASFVVRPPPDALAEFKVETSNYSAELGHSAGAVINASIKSGTNQIHGDLWEYFRNNVLDAKDWDALSVPKYRENQFGATLGVPILRNRLFFFGDAEANRIIFGQTSTLTVPTPLMRQGNFSELLSTNLTGAAQPTLLYQPNSGGTASLTCSGQQNVFCPAQINSVASTILNLYPSPNINGGRTYNNYVTSVDASSNTWQWDTRVDYNLSAKDQMFARFSYLHIPARIPSPLGPILDGNAYNDGTAVNLGNNFAGSETHVFNANLINEFRFAYSYGVYGFFQENYETNVAESLGMGGTQFGPDYPYNGGMPSLDISGAASAGVGEAGGVTTAGSPAYNPILEHTNAYQIFDNVTKIVGNHSLKFGVQLMSYRYKTLQPPYSHGFYTFSGLYTSNLGASFTGFGVADFVADQMHSADVSPEIVTNDEKWYRAGYAQDDWRVTRRLTLNLGLRYDYIQPYKEMAGQQASFITTGPLGIGTGSGAYQMPLQSKSVYLAPWFTSLLAKDNITLQYSNNARLATAQTTNFAPRIGFAFQVDPNTVVRAGWGMFYGGLANVGFGGNLANNYPFLFTATFPAANCYANNCPSLEGQGITLATGFSDALAVGLQNFPFTPALNGTELSPKTQYTMDYNLALQRSLSKDLTGTISYVGSAARHIVVGTNPNASEALVNPALSVQGYQPFPDFAGAGFYDYAGMSNYNSLQATLERRFADGLSFLATYTWAHSLDNAPDEFGSNADGGFRNTNLLPISLEYSNSAFDVRHRVTLNGLYELPFGSGRAHLNKGGIANVVGGGWMTSLTFTDQSGPPITIYSNIATAAGGGARAIRIADPFAAGGTPNGTNPDIACAPRTKTKTNWFNPCAFANPLPGTAISAGSPGTASSPAVPPQTVTNQSQVLAYLGGARNQIAGPGYERVNMSVFKDFTTYEAQKAELRVDIFNVFNTPSYGDPSVTNINSNGGQITAPQFFQQNTPDARFFQLSLKYIF
jgi:Carboxypeptidase regulatory-like domain/TonB dependent receptor